MFSGEEPQVKGSRSSAQVKGVNNIVVAVLGSDDVASSVPQLLDGAIASGVEHLLMLCLHNEARKCGRRRMVGPERRDLEAFVEHARKGPRVDHTGTLRLGDKTDHS